MKAILSALAACAVIAVAAGFAANATAQQNPRQADSHVMTFRLPDGTLEQIRYIGDRPPKIEFQGASPMALFAAPASDAISFGAPFADLDRISAMMDRQAAAMMREADSIDRAAFGPSQSPLNAEIGKLPPGVQGYSVVSTMSGNGVCTRSVRYFGAGDGKAPRVQTSTSGNCGNSHATAKPLPSSTPKTIAPRRGDVIEAGYHPSAAKRLSANSPLLADAANN
ncbi:MAG: hypothetical protein KGI75_13360 [Rhizobiaceae bacterium]|nr:hypothetical protein [Rhizobiaceae bacterium]